MLHQSLSMSWSWRIWIEHAAVAAWVSSTVFGRCGEKSCARAFRQREGIALVWQSGEQSNERQSDNRLPYIWEGTYVVNEAKFDARRIS